MNLQSRRVLVVGMARSGVAAARLLVRHGAQVTVNDSKRREELGDTLSPLAELPVTWALGQPAANLLAGQELMVISPGIPEKAAFVQQAKKMGIPVIGELELAARLNPGELVAITGTNGKTTTTTLVWEIFRNAGRRAFAVGNIGYPFSQAVLDSRPDDVMVCEVSSFQMETAECFHPRAAALLNITEDHLNRHGTMAEYTRMKMRVFQNQTEADFAVFNDDDPALAPLIGTVRARTLLFSRRHEVKEGAFVRDGVVIFRLDGREHPVCRAEEIAIPGPHNLENALAAVCLTGALGVPAAVQAETLRAFQGVEHRIEFVREVNGVRYINDSKGTNVDSTIRAVQTMDRPTVIILGGSDKHCSFTPLVEAMQAASMMREAVLIGETADQIEQTLRDNGWTAIHRAASLAEALRASADLAQPGWNVLLSPACASFDMFTDYEERGRMFKQLVQELPG